MKKAYLCRTADRRNANENGVFVFSSKGLANILIFLSKGATLLRIEAYVADDDAVIEIPKSIRSESKYLATDKQIYNTWINKSIASQSVSSTLDYSLPALLIGSAVTYLF